MLGRQTWPGAAQGLSSVPAHREGVRDVDCRVVCLGLLVAPQGGGDGSRPRVQTKCKLIVWEEYSMKREE